MSQYIVEKVAAIQWGITHEQEALKAYSRQAGIIVRPTGMN